MYIVYTPATSGPLHARQAPHSIHRSTSHADTRSTQRPLGAPTCASASSSVPSRLFSSPSFVASRPSHVLTSLTRLGALASARVLRRRPPRHLCPASLCAPLSEISAVPAREDRPHGDGRPLAAPAPLSGRRTKLGPLDWTMVTAGRRAVRSVGDGDAWSVGTFVRRHLRGQSRGDGQLDRQEGENTRNGPRRQGSHRP